MEYPSHTHNISLTQVASDKKCPKCNSNMFETGSIIAAVIECNLHSWICKNCNIKRQQAYDWSYFEPREWHRVLYSINNEEWIAEDEVEKLKNALENYFPLPIVKED